MGAPFDLGAHAARQQQEAMMREAVEAQREQQRQTLATLASRQEANHAERRAWEATTAAREAEATYWRERLERLEAAKGRRLETLSTDN